MSRFMRFVEFINEYEGIAAMLVCFILGVFSGFELGGLVLTEKEVEVVTVQDETGPQEVVDSVEHARAPQYTADGALVKVFTADMGILVGPQTYKFENPQLVELHPGTSQVKSLMKAENAVIEFDGGVTGEIKSAKWWGNFHQRTHKLREEAE